MPTDDMTQINKFFVPGTLDLRAQETELHFTDGSVVRVPTALLRREEPASARAGSGLAGEDDLTIPVVEEQIEVTKRTVTTGTVTLRKSTEEYDVTVEEPLAAITWKVERVAKGEVIPEALAPWQEGETTVYPLVEERLVMTRELVLVEEVRVTRETAERVESQTVTLRRETMRVDREKA